MSPEAEKLVAEAQAAGNRPAVMLAGLGAVLKLVISWIKSVERRLSQLEGSNGNK